jgi:predicted transcriptional regulator of viral defense system
MVALAGDGGTRVNKILDRLAWKGWLLRLEEGIYMLLLQKWVLQGSAVWNH